MPRRIQIVIGVVILFWGMMTLLGSVLDIDMGRYICSSLFIVLGVLVLLRPNLLPERMLSNFRFVSDAKRSGAWQVSNEEIWSFVGDMNLDMTSANIPRGETHLHLYAFVGSMNLVLPPEVGLCLTSTSFVTEANVLGQEKEAFAVIHRFQSPGYAAAEKRICLETTCFVSSIRVKTNPGSN